MDTVKILKTQDENYVRTQRAVELNVSTRLLASGYLNRYELFVP